MSEKKSRSKSKSKSRDHEKEKSPEKKKKHKSSDKRGESHDKKRGGDKQKHSGIITDRGSQFNYDEATSMMQNETNLKEKSHDSKPVIKAKLKSLERKPTIENHSMTQSEDLSFEKN